MYFSYSHMNDNIDVNFGPLSLTPQEELLININQIFIELEEYDIFYEENDLPNDVQKLKDLHQNIENQFNELEYKNNPIKVEADNKKWSVSIALDKNNKIKIEAKSKLIDDYRWISKYEWLELNHNEDFISVELKDDDLHLNKLDSSFDLKTIIKSSISELLLPFHINPDYLSEVPDEALIYPILKLKKAYVNIDDYVNNNDLIKEIYSNDPYTYFSYHTINNHTGAIIISMESNHIHKIIVKVQKS